MLAQQEESTMRAQTPAQPRKTTIAVAVDRLDDLHRGLRIIDGKRAELSQPKLDLFVAVDTLLSLIHDDYVQHILIKHQRDIG
jgi:hypothetical protein